MSYYSYKNYGLEKHFRKRRYLSTSVRGFFPCSEIDYLIRDKRLKKKNTTKTILGIFDDRTWICQSPILYYYRIITTPGRRRQVRRTDVNYCIPRVYNIFFSSSETGSTCQCVNESRLLTWHIII